jgi:hypothetical protein
MSNLTRALLFAFALVPAVASATAPMTRSLPPLRGRFVVLAKAPNLVGLTRSVRIIDKSGTLSYEVYRKNNKIVYARWRDAANNVFTNFFQKIASHR